MITLLLLTKLAFAQDYAPIKKGEIAPLSGTILAPSGMATIIAKCDADTAEAKLKGKYDLDKLQTECDLNEEKLQYDLELQIKTSEEIISIKDKELEKTYDIIKSTNKNNTSLWIGVGFAAGIATSFGTIYAYEAITND
jgi:hypothetical protein